MAQRLRQLEGQDDYDDDTDQDPVTGSALPQDRLSAMQPLINDPRFSYESALKEHEANLARFDEWIRRDREIAAIPYAIRLQRARRSLEYYEPDYRKQSAESVWRAGLNGDLFLEYEKSAVYADQDALQARARVKREERIRQTRVDFDIKRYRDHVAKGEQLRAPQQIVQPFVVATMAPAVVAAYAGIQTGAMIANARHACQDGTAQDCAVAVAPLAASAAGAFALRNAFRGPVKWVDEAGGMRPNARSYQSSATGARSNVATRKTQAPQITGKYGPVRFDGQEGNVLIDRKVSLTGYPKTKIQALRQAEALLKNRLTGRWEVPNLVTANQARKLLKKLKIKNIEVKIVKP